MAIAVSDPMGIAAGTYELDGSPDAAACVATTRPADVTLDVATLSALYLGADLANTLGRAGRIEGSADAVARFGAMLRNPVAPNCPEIF
jgi:predicted acetyltransferase